MAGNTSRLQGLGQGPPPLPAGHTSVTEDPGSPFGDPNDAPTPAPTVKKAKKERKAGTTKRVAWWKRPMVLAILGAVLALTGAAVIFKVKLKTAAGEALLGNRSGSTCPGTSTPSRSASAPGSIPWR
jgi:hypothetical protein